MTGEQLREIGERWLGDRWQTPISRILGVNARTVRRYATNELPIAPAVAARLLMLCELSEAVARHSGPTFVFAFDDGPEPLIYPSLMPVRPWVRRFEVVVPDHLDPTPLAVLARFLRAERDLARPRFDWREL